MEKNECLKIFGRLRDYYLLGNNISQAARDAKRDEFIRSFIRFPYRVFDEVISLWFAGKEFDNSYYPAHSTLVFRINELLKERALKKNAEKSREDGSGRAISPEYYHAVMECKKMPQNAFSDESWNGWSEHIKGVGYTTKSGDTRNFCMNNLQTKNIKTMAGCIVDMFNQNYVFPALQEMKNQRMREERVDRPESDLLDGEVRAASKVISIKLCYYCQERVTRKNINNPLTCESCGVKYQTMAT